MSAAPAGRGTSDLLRVLYDEHAHALYFYVVGLTGGDRGKAEDIVQDLKEQGDDREHHRHHRPGRDRHWPLERDRPRDRSAELRGRDITVNAVAPGPTATALFFDGKSQELIDRIAGEPPLERLGRPSGIAEMIAFLAGPARWISGQVISANGGSAA